MTEVGRRSFLLGCLTLLAPIRAEAGAPGWPRGYVSITYDDGLSSQLDLAVPQLDRAGFHATFYVTWDNLKDRAADWAALPMRGHQLANHTVTHPCDLQRYSPASFRTREVDPMQRWLRTIEASANVEDFAYPCDVTNLGSGSANAQALRYAQLLSRSGIVRARTSEGPPNSVHWVRRAPYRLQALALAYNTQSLSEVRTYLTAAMQRRRWAILVVHEIGNGSRSDGFISPAEHLDLLNLIGELGIPCGTVESAASFAKPS